MVDIKGLNIRNFELWNLKTIKFDKINGFKFSRFATFGTLKPKTI